MLIVLRDDATEDDVDRLRERLEAAGARTLRSRAGRQSVLACVPAGSPPPADVLAAAPAVGHVITEPAYPLASRAFRDTTAVRLAQDGLAIGDRALVVAAGPCAVEGLEMLRETAHAVRAAGATMLRGGAWKPRTSPYAFQGMAERALGALATVRAETRMPVVTEVMDPRDVELAAAHVDVLQIGARNMQNYPLLREVARVRRPVLLKRGMSATIRELLLAAEYILLGGNHDVILCERGIRTYETASRNTLDIAAIPVLKRETHLPVIVDPSHAAGRADLVTPLALAAIAAGADGLIVEVHPRPEQAQSDGEQSLTPSAFAQLMQLGRAVAESIGRTIASPRVQIAREFAA